MSFCSSWKLNEQHQKTSKKSKCTISTVLQHSVVVPCFQGMVLTLTSFFFFFIQDILVMKENVTEQHFWICISYLASSKLLSLHPVFQSWSLDDLYLFSHLQMFPSNLYPSLTFRLCLYHLLYQPHSFHMSFWIRPGWGLLLHLRSQPRFLDLTPRVWFQSQSRSALQLRLCPPSECSMVGVVGFDGTGQGKQGWLIVASQARVILMNFSD